jgi:hypothetical protein
MTNIVYIYAASCIPGFFLQLPILWDHCFLQEKAHGKQQILLSQEWGGAEIGAACSLFLSSEQQHAQLLNHFWEWIWHSRCPDPTYKFVYQVTNLVKFLREVFLPCTMAKLLNYQLKGSCFQKLIHENYNRGICDYNYISTKIWVLTCYAFLNLTSYNRDIFNYMPTSLIVHK